jgi:uncharacterized protein YegL
VAALPWNGWQASRGLGGSFRTGIGGSFQRNAHGVHKAGGIIVLAGGKVKSVSVSSVNNQGGKKEVLTLFHGKDGAILAPSEKDVAVFDLNFKRLAFSYAPLSPPGASQVPVNILLDRSGSMRKHMGTVLKATQSFMRMLPEFTRCAVTVFNGELQTLTQSDPASRLSCPQSANVLYAPIKASGSTALFKALDVGLSSGQTSHSNNTPIIAVAITDGVNTSEYEGGLDALKAKKAKAGAKLFVFWSGNYSQGHLEDLPDLEFVSTDNLRHELERFFKSLGISISGLQTLTLK